MINRIVELLRAELCQRACVREAKIIPGIRGGRGMVMHVCGVLALGIVALTPGQASATFLYAWQSTSGPTLNASFRVADSAVVGGTISASEILLPAGFSASSSVGMFTNLTATSALGVGPATGAVVVSTNGFTATNSTDTLVLSAAAYFIPSSVLQPHGRGNWKVTHLVVPPGPLQIVHFGFNNGQAQLLVTSATNLTFAIEASADLARWAPIVTNATVDGASLVTDPEPAGAAVRFYRAVIRQ